MDLIEVFCSNCKSKILRWPGKSMYFCNTNCKAEWQRSQKPIDQKWLYQKYIIEGLSCPKIAKIVNRDPGRVHDWLTDYGIPIRPRGTNYGQHFKKGQISVFKGHKHTEENKQKIREKRLKELADGKPSLPHLRGELHYLKRGDRKPTSWKGGITPERQRVYASRGWKEAVKIVWRRDDAKCCRCQLDHREIDRQKVKFHLHHLYSFERKHLRCWPDNIVLLCDKCHRWIHSKVNVADEFIYIDKIKMEIPQWLKSIC